MSEKTSKIIKASSKAGSDKFGFGYASLSDIAKAGIELPKMRLTVVDGKQFIEYLDGDDWQLGAEVITDFKSAGMNACQAYGSALTYARRYTAQLALGLAVDDDKNVETAGVQQRSKQFVDKPATDKQIALIRELVGDKADAVIEKNQPLTVGKASKLISGIKAKQAEEPKPAEPVEPEQDLTQPIDISDIPF